MFPNTIAWTFTAVPSSPTMPLMAMYFFARSLFQLLWVVPYKNKEFIDQYCMLKGTQAIKC